MLENGGGGSILEHHNVFNGTNLTLPPPLGVGRPLYTEHNILLLCKIRENHEWKSSGGTHVHGTCHSIIFSILNRLIRYLCHVVDNTVI